VGGTDVDPGALSARRRAVLNGFVRDAAGIEALGFPTFCRGVYVQDQGPPGKVIDFRTPVEIEGVRIAPGDLIFGDREGVLIVPAEVESEAVAAALAKASHREQGRDRHSGRYERA
jgi:4-hydroxy-4-methyl-2-oxoglutarate aldolase